MERDDQPGSVRGTGVTRQSLLPGKTPMRTPSPSNELARFAERGEKIEARSRLRRGTEEVGFEPTKAIHLTRFPVVLTRPL